MAWNPPGQDTKKREAMPSTCFLIPKEKKYPYKTNVNGKWKPSKTGLMAAYKRARQQGDNTVASKALRLLKIHFGYDPKD